MTGKILVAGSGVFLYWRMASWNASMLIAPSFLTLPVINLLMILTPISALQLLWGNATELRRWCIPQLCRNCLVVWATNLGPPSDESSSGMPKVAKVCLRTLISPCAPSLALSTIGQLGVSVNDDEVSVALVVEVVCTYALEWVLR